MRKLVSVQKILGIEPIEGADKIEKTTILGWQVVTAKSDGLKVGDLVVYAEVDTLLPPKPEFEFLKERKYRIRTIKLKKTVSQGIVFPLSILPKGKYHEGDDVTSLIGARKYDPQADTEAKLLKERQDREKNKIARFMMRYMWWRNLFVKDNRSAFPSFIKKTDEDRIQLFPNICEEEKDTVFTMTEKLDGQSATYFLVKQRGWFGKPKYKFGVCSRNYLLNRPDNSSYWTVAKQLNIEKTLKELILHNKFVVLQGEIIGSGIQNNKYGINGYDFYAFNLVYPSGQDDDYLMRLQLEGKIKCVPCLDVSFKLPATIQNTVEFSRGQSLLAKVKREGVVFRDYAKGLSFKVVNPDFLLEYAE